MLSSAGFYQPGDKIWVGDGRPSNEMYILLSGALAVINGQGRRVAAIKPVTTVGELGLITSQPRSATIEAVQPSNIHVVPKPLFDQLLHDDMEMQVIIYRNVIDVLYNKLVHDNVPRPTAGTKTVPYPGSGPGGARGRGSGRSVGQAQ